MAGRAPKQAAADRRKTILDGARGVFAASSYAQADTGDLAAAAGVKPPALYRYFPTKRELYLATLADAGPQLLNLWKQGLASAPSPLDAIWNIGMAYYDHAATRSPVMRLWFQAVAEASDPEVREVVAETLGGAVGLFAENIERGKAAGLVREDLDATVAAWHFMAIGFAMDLICLLGFEETLTREEVEDWGRLYLDSIRASQKNAPGPPGTDERTGMSTYQSVVPREREDLIRRAWYSHDARWFNAVAEEFGMDAANRLNRKAVRATGAVEAKRLHSTLGLPRVDSVAGFLEFMDAGRDLYVAAPLIEMATRAIDERSYTVHVERCFVADNISRAGIAESYQCAVFDRIQGWHDGLGFPLAEDLAAAGCAIAIGKPCIRTFETAAAPTAE